MGKRRETIKALERRRFYLENKLEALSEEEYPAKQYEKAELSALNYVLKGLLNHDRDI